MSSANAVFKSGVTLAAIAAICTSLVALTYHLTADRIAANDKALLEQSLHPALSDLFYDSGVSESRLVLAPPQWQLVRRSLLSPELALKAPVRQ